jgi:hypothetical protein
VTYTHMYTCTRSATPADVELATDKPTLSVEIAAEPVVEQILLHLWRAIDLNENEQCGKRVQVLYTGDNQWYARTLPDPRPVPILRSEPTYLQLPC